jgi:hypothetical protein
MADRELLAATLIAGMLPAAHRRRCQESRGCQYQRMATPPARLH